MSPPVNICKQKLISMQVKITALTAFELIFSFLWEWIIFNLLIMLYSDQMKFIIQILMWAWVGASPRKRGNKYHTCALAPDEKYTIRYKCENWSK